MPGDDIDNLFGDHYTMIYQHDELIKKTRFPCNGEVVTEFCMNQDNAGCNKILCIGINQNKHMMNKSTSDYAVGTSGINQDDITTSEDEDTVKIMKRKTNQYDLDMNSYAEIFYDIMQEGSYTINEEDKKIGHE